MTRSATTAFLRWGQRGFPFEKTQLGVEATVDSQARTCDEGSLITREVSYHARYLINMSESIQCQHIQECLCVRSSGWIEIGIGRTGLNVINGDAAWSQIARQTFGSPSDRRLG